MMVETPDVPETLQSFYTAHVFICTNERPEGHPRGSCAGHGSVKLRDYMKARAKEFGLAEQRIRTQQAGCLDRCELGPVLVVYPEGIWYAPRTREDIDAILLEHLRDGRPVERLMLLPTDREAADLLARQGAAES